MTNYTVLMAHDARLPEGLKCFQAGGHGKFQVEGWTRPDQPLTWQVTVPDEDAYAVNVLACRGDDRPVELTVSAAGRSVSGTLRSASGIWTRQALGGALRLPKGPQTITLRARPLDGAAAFAASVFAVELVRPAVRDRLHEAAVAQRSDTAWLQKAGYGLMSHWTSETCPRRGRPKPYAQAAQDFDVEMLANQVQEAGAGFLVLTTSHAQFYFPAPIQAIDRILPGRTAPRDLVADLADALGKRGIRLMLYYHIGASSDPQWLKASGFWETDTSRIFGNWTAIISEVGQRYGDRLAGWWFDDGSINYYYRSAPWERLTRAAKAGNANRLVGYNPWILPSPTEFQDFCCGEGFRDAGAGGLVPVGGDGRYTAGSYQGLQACATLIAEGDWVHARKDTEIGKPRWSAEQLATVLSEFAKFRNVPIFNLEIYQEGTVWEPQKLDWGKGIPSFGGPCSFAYFDLSGSVEVAVTSHNQPLDAVKILPLSGGITLQPGEDMLMENVRFEDIRIHQEGQGRLIQVEPLCTQWNRTKTPGRIRDCSFKNITVYGTPKSPDELGTIRVNGPDNSHDVRNVRFENVVRFGQLAAERSSGVDVSGSCDGVVFAGPPGTPAPPKGGVR